MFRFLGLSAKFLLACGLALALLVPPGSAQATERLQVLYRFQGLKAGDGASPVAGVIADSAGNLYGTTTAGGGGGSSCNYNYDDGCGTVFRLAPDGTETPLYSFCSIGGCPDGGQPEAGLIASKGGALFGTTTTGGSKTTHGGTVFRVGPDGRETVLYAFNGHRDGVSPYGGLIHDSLGNRYGTTVSGGGPRNGGTVFKLAPDGTETVFYTFCHLANCTDGEGPIAGLIRDSAGIFYGTTVGGGAHGYGTVFKLAPDGTEAVLYSFAWGSDGYSPESTLVADSAGNLYGVTTNGGGGTGCGSGCGIVFKVAPDGTETVLYRFTGGTDGGYPGGTLVLDRNGDLYGTTGAGGDTQLCQGSGCGTLFKLAPDGLLRVLHRFRGPIDGEDPRGGLILRKGFLYGTTAAGGGSPNCSLGGCGTVFSYKK